MDYDDDLRHYSPELRKFMRGPTRPWLEREKPGQRVGGRSPARRPQVTIINAVISGGGSGLVAGRYVDQPIPFNCRILSAELLANAAGIITLDVRTNTYANFPPAAGDSIVGSNPPSLNGDDQMLDDALTGWTPLLVSGNTLRWIVTAVTGGAITQITCALKVAQT